MSNIVIQEIATPVGGGSESQIVGQWTLLNAFFTDVNFGTHDYGSEEMVDISLTIQYDWAEYEKSATGQPVVP